MEVVQIEKKRTLLDQAEEVIEMLNQKTGRSYRAKNPRGAPSANADFIIARLREGYTLSDCKAVIGAKYRQWAHDEKMVKFLTPETIFRRSNFERYLGEIGE
jgi:uncharacterized phage protein (TIGR02220 family)